MPCSRRGSVVIAGLDVALTIFHRARGGQPIVIERNQGMSFGVGVDARFGDADRRKRDVANGRLQLPVDVGNRVSYLGHTFGGSGSERLDALVSDLVVQGLHGTRMPVLLGATNAGFERAVVVRIEGALDYLAQDIRLQRCQRVNLGLLDSERFTPTVGSLLRLLER